MLRTVPDFIECCHPSCPRHGGGHTSLTPLSQFDRAMNTIPPPYHQLAIPPLLPQKARGWEKVTRWFPPARSFLREQSFLPLISDAMEVWSEGEQSLLPSSDVPCKCLFSGLELLRHCLILAFSCTKLIVFTTDQRGTSYSGINHLQ